MNRKIPKLKHSRPAPKPLTLGDVFGEKIRETLDARERRAELDALGFVEVRAAP